MVQHDGDHGEAAHTVENGPARRGAKVVPEGVHPRRVPTALTGLTLLLLFISGISAGAVRAGDGHVQVAAAAATPPVCASGVQTIESGGLQRRFVVWRPEAASAAPARPILLLFHGYTGSPDSVTDSSQLPQAAVARGWVVVVPLGSGSPPRWELQSLPAPDDIVFVRQLIGDVAAGRCADASRVVAAGFSNGAGFTARLTCEVRLVGSVMVGGANLGPSCDVPDGYPMVIAHGDADTVVPVAGGPVIGGALHARPLDHTIAEWTAKGAAVTTIIEPGWGHSWVPGTNDAVLRMLATFAV